MKMEMMLVEINSKDKIAGHTDTVVFIPVKKELKDYVELRVKGPICSDVLHALGLPNKLKDTIEVEVLAKGTQKELPGKGENGKKSGQTNKSDTGS